MDQRERKVHYLEGLGYCAAFMIGLGGLSDVESVKYFNVLGLVFAVIVIIRLMVMNITVGLVGHLYEPMQPIDSDVLESEKGPADE